ncbi:MAG: endolytic transglycosylase MltG [Candidatus Eisenbacteria bacterium]|nr:endolytic transglycosylase MltG [Candidatus Eisenbacteria bacterium]
MSARAFLSRAAIAVALAALAALGVLDYRFYQGPVPEGESVPVLIPRGAGFRETARLLEREGILEDARWFYWVGRIRGEDRRIRAGRYLLVPGTPGGRVLHALRRGTNEVIRVTVPEGLWVEETVRILADRLGLDEEEIARAARDTSLVRRFGVPGPTMEGYLFPETYLFFWDETAETVLGRMTARFREVFGEEEEARAAEMGLTPREAITLASIVEAEAVVDEERPRIAAVYHNRLEIGWKLQADPTVQYARKSRERLLLRDLETDSPYNTYLHTGLPPGPICSPGEASIRAVLRPTEGSRELFFVANGENGRHTFSRDQNGHIRAKREAKRRRQSP